MQGEGSLPAAPGNARVRVYALGGFTVEVDGTPLRFAHRAPRRPLALLKVLIALGGEGVAAERVCDALWPDAEGDDAAHSLSVTLTRLRHLIGTGSVRMRDGRVGLEPQLCWVDALACGPLLEEVRRQVAEGRPALAAAPMAQALELYRGRLLEDETGPAPVLAARERLNGRLLQQVAALAEAHRSAGSTDAALALYQRGLALDELAEPVVQGLLGICLESGRLAEGLAAFQRYEAAVRAALNAEPSPALRALCERVRAAAEALDRPATWPRDDPALAIMAFENLSGDPWQARFSDGLVDTIAIALAKIPGVRVVARHATDAFRGQAVDLGQIGRTLGVRHVLEGNVLRSGERLRITAQLTDTHTGALVWVGSYDRSTPDVLAVMDEIARNLVAELGASVLYGESMRYYAGTTASGEALDKFLLGVHLYHQFEAPMNASARAAAAAAIQRDPGFAQAMALLGIIHLHDYRFGWTRDAEATFREAERWAQRCRKTDPGCSLGRNLEGNLLCHHGQYDDALALSERGVEREPGQERPNTHHAATLLFAGRYDEAFVAAQRSLRMSPRPTMVAVWVAAESRFMPGSGEESRPYFEFLMERNAPRGELANNARRRLIAIHLRAGRATQARSLVEQEMRVNPNFTVTRCGEMWRHWPFKDRSWLAPYLDALRQAGLPG